MRNTRLQLHDQQVHLGSWQVPQPLPSRVSSQWIVPEFSFSSPSLKRLILVWSPRTLGCTSAGPEGTARRFEISFSAAEGPGKRTPGKPGVPGLCPRGWVCDTGALGFSTHAKVVDVCCALGGEDAGAERNCWWFETTLARRMDLCTVPHGWVWAIASRATKGTVLLRPSPTAKEGSSTGCPELSWRRRCRARAAEHVQSCWA